MPVLSQLVEGVLNRGLCGLAADRKGRIEGVDIALDSDHESVGRGLRHRSGRRAVRRTARGKHRVQNAETDCSGCAELEHITTCKRSAKGLQRRHLFLSTALYGTHHVLPEVKRTSAGAPVARCPASPNASSSSPRGVAQPPNLRCTQPRLPRSASSSAYLNRATVASVKGT